MLSAYKMLNDCDNVSITKKINVRKCDGKLSSEKINSCSLKESVICMTEMAQEDTNASWDNLPSVILHEIFLYLSHENRLRASQVCTNWRHALFHPSFWKKITFSFKDEESISWARFLVDCFGLSVQEVTIRCDTINKYINETTKLLKKLSFNRQLHKLFLESNMEWPVNGVNSEEESHAFGVSLMTSLVRLVKTTQKLEALSLGCIEELTANASLMLEPLQLYHSKHLTHLSLASVKDDSEHYDFLELEDSTFKSFVNLSILTLDYDFLSDALLKSLDNGLMKRLVIHVHGWHDDYAVGTSNEAWQYFVEKNPFCELRLNLIHSYVGVKALDSDILRAAMPLTHLKVLFCENVNIRAFNRLSNWYQQSLQSIMWIDSMDSTKTTPPTVDPDDPNSPDPLVLVAWKCTKLTEVVLIGHPYYPENLLAIARLRGKMLKSLVFPESNVESANESWNKTEALIHEIQKIMGPQWRPVSDAELPAVLIDPFKGDSREVIMPLVLRDQK